MTRILCCGVMLLAASAAARAGELDKEFASAKVIAMPAKAAIVTPTELDKESPTPAGHGGGGHGGSFHGGGGWGHAGWGHTSWGHAGWGHAGWGWGGGWGWGYPWGWNVRVAFVW